jgi:hypothetical protein
MYNSGAGAVWVYSLVNGFWQPQGQPLIGTGATGAASQGTSVSLSEDGNTLVEGGSADNSGTGAAWVFTRSNGVWSQQGAKFVGAGAAGSANPGSSVALSAAGNTALIGSQNDNSHLGAAWVFTRTNGNWSQMGSKLVGSGASAPSEQGRAVAISGDAGTILLGGPEDANFTGATWPFVITGPAPAALRHKIPAQERRYSQPLARTVGRLPDVLGRYLNVPPGLTPLRDKCASAHPTAAYWGECHQCDRARAEVVEGWPVTMMFLLCSSVPAEVGLKLAFSLHGG